MADPYPCQGHDYPSQEDAAIAAEMMRYNVRNERNERNEPTEVYRCVENHWHWRIAAMSDQKVESDRTRRLCDLAPLMYIYDPRPAEETGPLAWLRDLAPGTRLPLYNRAGEHVADAVLGERIPADDEELRFEVAPPRE